MSFLEADIWNLGGVPLSYNRVQFRDVLRIQIPSLRCRNVEGQLEDRVQAWLCDIFDALPGTCAPLEISMPGIDLETLGCLFEELAAIYSIRISLDTLRVSITHGITKQHSCGYVSPSCMLLHSYIFNLLAAIRDISVQVERTAGELRRALIDKEAVSKPLRL